MARIFKVREGVTKDMSEMCHSFGNPFEIVQAEREDITIETFYSTMKMAGVMPPGTVTLFDDNDALAFKLKFGDLVTETHGEEHDFTFNEAAYRLG